MGETLCTPSTVMSLTGLRDWERELLQADQRVRHQLHAIVPLLDVFKPEQQPLALVFPRKRPLDTQA
jgi:hypothetical protein